MKEQPRGIAGTLLFVAVLIVVVITLAALMLYVLTRGRVH
jgi:flagellar basal body-associated protein FliL